MRSRSSEQLRLESLQKWRNSPDPDLSLSFLQKQFKREIEKPHKQLGRLAQQWATLLPRELAQRTRLEGLSRGVLHVAVQSSMHLYELDRLLRSGLEQQLRAAAPGQLRRVQLRVTADAGL